MSDVGGELHHALEELLTDLFQSPRAADAAPTLCALTSLAASFPSAQKRLGQILSRDAPQSTKHSTRSVAQLQLLAQRFLYDSASASETLALLAVLAYRNVANQRRIARHVKGVCIEVPSAPPTRDMPLVLMVLSLPTALQAQYRAWNSRHRELLACRVPSGAPPALDGVPAACFCDECLGAPQLLATWVSHYEDLSRWRSRNDPNALADSVHRLGSEEFLQHVLVDAHNLRTSHWTMKHAKEDAPRSSLQAVVDGDAPVVYYFERVPEGQLAAVADPQHHACAILVDPIAASIVRSKPNVAEEFSSLYANAAMKRSTQEDSSNGNEWGELDRVLLLETRVELLCCEPPRTQMDGPARTPWLPTISRFLSNNVELECTATPEMLCSEVDRNEDVADWERRIFTSIVSFLEPERLVDLLALRKELLPVAAPSAEEENVPVRTEMTAVRVVAAHSGQTLDFIATTSDGDEFAAQVSIDDLNSFTTSPETGSMSLLSVSEESLLEALQHCRLCTRDDPAGCSSVECCLHLQRREPTGNAASVLDNALDNISIENPSHIKISRPAVDKRGLSSSAEHQLRVLSVSLASSHEVKVLDAANRIRRTITDCNERMVQLASSADRTDSQRKASRERCRVCRDLLIQAGKRMKLGAGTDTMATLTAVAKTRLQRSITRVLQVSESEEVWETPDERVQRLHLSKHTWASGVPDPEFYVENQARAKTNSTAQRRLNHLLVKQKRQQRDIRS